MDRVKLIGVEIFGHHGVTKAEQDIGQKFKIDVEMLRDLSEAGKSDNVKDTVDYTKVYRILESVIKERRYKLIEAMAEDTAAAILERFSSIERVIVRIKKPGAAIGGILDRAEVEIERGRR